MPRSALCRAGVAAGAPFNARAPRAARNRPAPASRGAPSGSMPSGRDLLRASAVPSASGRASCAASRRAARRGSRTARGRATANGGAACGTSRTTVRPDLRRRRERAGADVEAGLGARQQREHDREAPVLLAARRGRHAVDDLALQHHVQVLDDAARTWRDGTAAASRCCRAGCRRRAASAGPSRARRSRTRSASASCTTSRSGCATRLGNAAASSRSTSTTCRRSSLLEQRNRQRAGAAADLDHRVGRQRADGVDEPADDGGIVQEVLAEPLLGAHARSQSELERELDGREQAARRARGPCPRASSAVP